MDQKFNDQLESQDGINVTALPAGTKLNVETCHSIYQLEIKDGREITILGGMLRSGEFRFPLPIPAAFSGSVIPFTNMLKLDWLGRGMQMEIVFETGIIRTSPVLKLEFESMDW